MTRLVLVRHGESLWNAERRLQGDTDVELSERGRRQARALAPLVRGFVPETVVTSDLSRAVETARLLGLGDARRDARWREIVVGEWAGERIPDLLARDEEAFRGWRAGTHTPPGGEPWLDFAARAEAGLAAALDGGSPRCVLVVTHGGAIRATVARLLGIGPGSLLPVEPASATVLELGAVPRLAAYNLVASAAAPEAGANGADPVRDGGAPD